jgi:PAS domain S-box-containing protein
VARARRRFLNHERRVLVLSLAAGAPAVAVALGLLYYGDFSSRLQWTLGVLLMLAWWGFASAARGTVVHPLQTLSNLLGALREEDFSFRARGTRGDDALSQVMLELNLLADTLREERLGALEATALLRKVMEEIEVAVFTFDEEQRLKLVNKAGERILARPSERLLGHTATELGLSEALIERTPIVLERTFPGASGRFEIRRTSFREGGRPHQLLVLTNVSRALRDEERQAWQRLIRVLGHELNNSLAPIKSIAGSLETMFARATRADDWEEDARRGLAVIRARAESLARFMDAYARLARLPAPQLQPLEVGALLRRVAGLETRASVELAAGPSLTIRADSDQIEQLLINLVRNAVDAAAEAKGGVRLGWRLLPGSRLLEVFVEDEGPGLPPSANLFVPFFTTKPQGSGIGLVLCRQIAEAHEGTLTLENRSDRTGCIARLRLPVA